MIHRFCWCEKEDCPWGNGCTCPDSVNHYFIDDKEVSYRKWMRYYTDNVPSTSNPKWNEISEEVNKHRTSRHDGICDYCTGKGIYERFKLKGIQTAPNFWHRPSGLKVWWYKWLGRSMEIENPNHVDYKKVIDECIKSIGIKNE